MQFLNTGLRHSNKSAFHALAIDEHRKAFAPTLWTVDFKKWTPPPHHGRTFSQVEQRWFVGAHANVGGGCQSDPLSLRRALSVRARALWGLTRNLRKPRNTAKCPPTLSLHFCYPGATGLRFRLGRQPAVEPAAPLSRHNPHDARSSGSSLGAAPWSKFELQSQPSVRQAALE